jgi:hypothetical protein
MQFAPHLDTLGGRVPEQICRDLLGQVVRLSVSHQKSDGIRRKFANMPVADDQRKPLQLPQSTDLPPSAIWIFSLHRPLGTVLLQYMSKATEQTEVSILASRKESQTPRLRLDDVRSHSAQRNIQQRLTLNTKGKAV